MLYWRNAGGVTFSLLVEAVIQAAKAESTDRPEYVADHIGHEMLVAMHIYPNSHDDQPITMHTRCSMNFHSCSDVPRMRSMDDTRQIYLPSNSMMRTRSHLLARHLLYISQVFLQVFGQLLTCAVDPSNARLYR